LTKASSKSRSSVSASSSGTVPVATVRPWATTTTLSHRRSTSCMMWVEKTMHLAPPSGERSQRRLSRKGARREDVEAVGRLVENDVGGVVDESAHERGLHPLALAEAGGAPVEQRRHVEHAGEVLRARVGRLALHAVQRAVVDDVLARRQARIEAARVGQHAHPRQHLARSRDDVDAVDAHRPGLGRDERGEHAQRRRLAGAVRAEQAGDAAVRRVEADVATAWTRGAPDGAFALPAVALPTSGPTRASRRPRFGAGAANDLARPRTSIIAPASC
jgi:hypothetical protein